MTRLTSSCPPSGVPHWKRSVYALREKYWVFSEKPSIAQLLGTFHSHPQLEAEDFFEYLHTLTQIFHSSLKQKPDTVSDAKMAAREQFVERIRSSAQWRELHKMVRDKTEWMLFYVFQWAVAWSLEDNSLLVPSGTRGAKSMTSLGENVVEGSPSMYGNQEKPSATLDKIVEVVWMW